MTAWYDDDDRLAEELAASLREDRQRIAAELDADRRTLLMAGYDIVMADTIEAELAFDSAIDEGAMVRGDDAGVRMLTYTAGGDTAAGEEMGVEIEFEVAGGRVTGHVEPVSAGHVILEQPANPERMVVSAEPDGHGSFEFVLRSPATFRLRYVDAAGRSVATGWVDGPHDVGR